MIFRPLKPQTRSRPIVFITDAGPSHLEVTSEHGGVKRKTNRTAVELLLHDQDGMAVYSLVKPKQLASCLGFDQWTIIKYHNRIVRRNGGTTMRDDRHSMEEGRKRDSPPQPPTPARTTWTLALHIYKPCWHPFRLISAESATARQATVSYPPECLCPNKPGDRYHFVLEGVSEGENSAALAMVLVRDVGRARSLILRLLREQGESLLPELGKDTS